MTRPQQPERIRLVASRDGFVERRRNRRLTDDEFFDEEMEPLLPITKPASRADVYWIYITLFVLCSALGGFLIAAFGLFQEVGR